MIHNVFVSLAARGFKVASCPLCRGAAMTLAELYEHAQDHTLRDVRGWVHRQHVAFRVDPGAGGWYWECACSATTAARFPSEDMAVQSHRRHDCPDCFECRVDRAVARL